MGEVSRELLANTGVVKTSCDVQGETESMQVVLSAVLISFALISLFRYAGADTPAADEAAIQARSLVSMGDTARLQHALAKARRGEKVVVAVIGGSITQGASAGAVEDRYGNVIAAWWRERFPTTEVQFVNAGIGATGSNIAAHRAQDHLIRHKPDFVVIEFGVNDPNTELAAETLEGLVRQILREPNQPAAMLLFTMHRNGGNAQEWHSKIGRHYALPMVSFRDALWPEIEAGRMKWEDVEADEVHPNKRGHHYCAQFVNALVAKVADDLPVDSELPAIKPTPAPLISDTYEHTAILNSGNLTPLRAEGWTDLPGCPFGPGWAADQPESVLELTVPGTAVSLIFHRIKGDMGIIEAQVDGRPAVRMNAWFNADWGGYSACEMVGQDLGPGPHTLRITLLKERAEASAGNRFELQAVLAAGLSRSGPQ